MNIAGQCLQWLTAKGYRTLLFFFALVCLLYLPSYYAKFTSDFITWTFHYDQQGPAGLLNDFDDPSLKYMYHILMYGGYRLFGTYPLGWYIACNLLHAFNATLLLVFVRKLLQHLKIDRRWLPLTAALFFLVSPYQTEAVVWAAAIHFLFASAMVLLSLISLMRFFEHRSGKRLWGIFLPFLFGLFATEASFILPLLLCALTVLLAMKSDLHIPAGKTALTILLPAFLMLAGFVALTYLRFGNPVGHYGTAMHLNINLSYIGVNVLKYFLKFVCWFRYLPISHRGFSRYMDQGMNGAYVLIVLGVIAVVLLVLLRRMRFKASLLVFFLFSFLIALLPVINLETLFIKDIQSDRYGYLPSLFFYPVAAAAIHFIFRGWLRHTLVLLYLVLSMVCLNDALQKWRFAGKMIDNLIRTFPHPATGRIFILNVADTYCGAYCLRMGLQHTISRQYSPELAGRINILGNYNMYAAVDSVKVTPAGPDTYEVQVSDWGGWIWGMPEGDSPKYKVVTDGSGLHYTVRFKDLKPDDLILYQAGKEWRYVHRTGQ